MSTSSARKGFARLPRAIFDDPRLSGNHIGLLLYLQSHKPGWICRVPDMRETLRLSENLIYRLLRELENWGYLHRKNAMRNGKRAGLFVTVLVEHLNPQNGGLEDPTKPPKAKLGNQGSNKESNKEGDPNSEVIDDGDRARSQKPSLRVIGGGGSSG